MSCPSGLLLWCWQVRISQLAWLLSAYGSTISTASLRQIGSIHCHTHTLQVCQDTILNCAASCDDRHVSTRHLAILPMSSVACCVPVPAAGVLITISIIMMSRRVAARTALKSQIPRVLNLIATICLAGGIAVSGWATSGQTVQNLSSFSNVFLVFFGTVLLLRLLPLVYYSVLGRLEVFKDLANATYYIADFLLVYLLNGLRFVLSLFDILTGLQAQLLFNTSYARQVRPCAGRPFLCS